MMRRALTGILVLMGIAGALTAQDVALKPVPDLLARNRAREMIRGIFAREYGRSAPADRQALARTLLAQGRETHDDAAAQYVALTEAADLAAGAADAVTALAAVNELAERFAVNALELKRAALVRAHGAAGGPAESQAIMRLALETAHQAADVDAFDLVRQLVNLTESAAQKTQSVRTVASVQASLSRLRELSAEFDRVKVAFARLETEPHSTEAHLTIGRFYALHKGQWSLGLEHLAAGSDPELRDLARRELARPAEGLEQAALGDAWWAYAEKTSGPQSAIITAHAADWYRQAQQTIRGITLARIASRIEMVQGQSGGAGAAAVDLLGLVDPPRDAAQGQWSRNAEGILSAGSAYACLRLAYAPPEEYDLRVTFTRLEGEGPVAVLLAAQQRAFGFALDVRGEARFERVNDKAAQDNPTTVPVVISNGRLYNLTVEVRKDRVGAILDGKPLCEWKTDYRDLSRYTVWKLADNTVCGIGAHNARVLFHVVEMVEVAGKGRPLRAP